MKNRHRWILMLLALCSAALLTGSVAERRDLAVEARVDALQEDLAGEVFRFHVIANSDSDQDQALKYQVRDQVIVYMRRSLGEEDVSLEETKEWAGEHLREIEEVARKALKEAGSSDRVKARVARVYFPDKRYGEIWFPQGYYEALQIRLGERSELVVRPLPQSLLYRFGVRRGDRGRPAGSGGGAYGGRIPDGDRGLGL